MRGSIILGMALFCALVAAEISLQSEYDACGPGGGYDKLLELNPSNTYIGSLNVQDNVKSCIHGYGALINLMSSGGARGNINASGTTTVLDVDHCVIRGGNEALNYTTTSSGRIMNCTFYDCYRSIRAWNVGNYDGVFAYNNIISYPINGYGVVRYQGAITTLLYNDVWSTTPVGKYMEWCSG